ncbi:uncharacterized protein C8Q71DRAFT_70690 [Rhodofomes roseus]|uniref:Uncharacterized protein n=1 Tax=Rhodofomes roseus TaxID=34475 RepID=A0A4Y9YH92_9APHY|nr:uncharacterized protein C8Q71DRAFT_70690 [Rhodofomes roseus]KAH9836189.1 hypothetical protein C8Q71DRAFT_70690 [Rhodofomes roseus]TFY60957.1 hypothetical protein EVJ58_g4821 [Rhodofomes roseus]
MLAVHKPPPAHFAPPLFRPTHSRHSTAPVVIKPTHTPGLLSLSKPTQPALRPQSVQRERQVRSSPRGKKSTPAQQAPALAPAVEDSKPSSTPAKADGAAADKAKVQSGPAPAADKSTRGRQPSKPAKDKAQRRSASSCSRIPARRPAHQPSPPPADRIPSQAEVTVQRPTKSRPTQSTSVSGLNDPFAIFESSTEAAPKESAKAGSKGPAFRPLPPLAQPSGKLARRRQINARASPTPTAPKTQQQRKDRIAALVGSVTEDLSQLSIRDEVSATHIRRSKANRAAAEGWPVFPVCDDSSEADDSDDTPPTTPIRESASVPVKKHVRHWPTQGAHDAPRTAPLSSTFVFPFIPSPSSSPTPAQRRRNHRRVPSEGVFHMSMDEDSSSSSASEFPPTGKVLHPRSKRPAPQPRESVAGEASTSAPQAGFFAGSAFQNSPSPDELPPPSF